MKDIQVPSRVNGKMKFLVLLSKHVNLHFCYQLLGKRLDVKEHSSGDLFHGCLL